jgi:uncharacterized protein (TIRG00374 family)
VVVERVLDMLTTIAMLGLLIPFVPLPDGSMIPLLAATGLAVTGLLVIIVAGSNPHRAHAITRLISNRLPGRYADKVHGILDSFLEGFAVLSTPRVAVRLVLYSVAIWMIIALAFYCVLFAFHLRLPPAAPMFVLALVSLSFIIPSSPGHVGVFQFVAVRALEIGFGVDAGVALSFALVAHVVSFVPPTVLGAWFIWRSGLSFSRLVSFGRSDQGGGGGQSGGQPEPAPALTRGV